MTSRYPLAFVIFSLFMGVVCLRLGVWQLDRLDTRRATNASALAERALPEVDARTLHDSTGNRRARATGAYDYDQEIILRGRGRSGVPGVEVVTPMRLAGSDSAILVLRGYVPSADAIGYDAQLHREADSTTVSGITMAVPIDPTGARPAERNGTTTWRRLDLATLRERLPYPIAPVYIIADSPATVSPAPLRSSAPPLDDGPHLNYAIQWFGFATIAFGGAAAIWWKRRHPAAPMA
ncbi:MAG: SURF1 family protein [Gemmatimonadales bacterium]